MKFKLEQRIEYLIEDLYNYQSIMGSSALYHKESTIKTELDQINWNMWIAQNHKQKAHTGCNNTKVSKVYLYYSWSTKYFDLQYDCVDTICPQRLIKMDMDYRLLMEYLNQSDKFTLYGSNGSMKHSK